jgi:hypothetical protein
LEKRTVTLFDRKGFQLDLGRCLAVAAGINRQLSRQSPAAAVAVQKMPVIPSAKAD